MFRLVNLRTPLLRISRCLYRPAMSGPVTADEHKRKLVDLRFDNSALSSLPIDKIEENYVRDPVPNACFSLVEPTPVVNPKLVAVSLPALALLDLAPEEAKNPDFVQYFSGNKILPGSRPAAHCYCGHQFGLFSGQLGDGAAMYLGEIVNHCGERWEIQLKGAGPTPYSRSADGRKVLRSSIREFLCSEAMHFLGIPTTRAGALVTSDTMVVRDMFYDGHPTQERCSVVLRIAQTFLRFGSFEICKPRDAVTDRRGPSVGNKTILPQLLDYVIQTHYPQIASKPGDVPERYKLFYREICKRTAYLVALWQTVGFCHGVLNTDNMSILGLTIDYGPFGFLDRFDRKHVCNTSDDSARYTYEAQPKICKWNCMKLAEALHDLIPQDEAKAILEDVYDTEYTRAYNERMAHKLGLFHSTREEDPSLVKALLDTMEVTGADFTKTFRLLSFGCTSTFEEFYDRLAPSIASLETLRQTTKPPIPEKHLATILGLYQQDPRGLMAFGISEQMVLTSIERIEMQKKYAAMTQKDKDEESKMMWQEWFARYRERLRKDDDERFKGDAIDPSFSRAARMNAINPSFVLRNHIAQFAISKAEEGDYSEVNHLLERASNPFVEDPRDDAFPPPGPIGEIGVCRVSCSS